MSREKLENIIESEKKEPISVEVISRTKSMQSHDKVSLGSDTADLSAMSGSNENVPD